MFAINLLQVLGVITIVLQLYNAENFHFFQNDYDVILDHAICSALNKTMYKYMKVEFVLRNRTYRVFNASWEQTANLGGDIIQHSHLYKFSSNEYRPFPVFFSLNICTEYMLNSFGSQDLFAKSSFTNMKPCNMKKGSYYLRHAMPDFSTFPPHVPRGLYKLVNKFTYRSYLLFEWELYAKLVDKPIDWKNIPKHEW